MAFDERSSAELPLASCAGLRVPNSLRTHIRPTSCTLFAREFRSVSEPWRLDAGTWTRGQIKRRNCQSLLDSPCTVDPFDVEQDTQSCSADLVCLVYDGDVMSYELRSEGDRLFYGYRPLLRWLAAELLTLILTLRAVVSSHRRSLPILCHRAYDRWDLVYRDMPS